MMKNNDILYNLGQNLNTLTIYKFYKVPFLYFKSMKFFKTLSLAGLLGASVNATFAAIDCGEGKVPSFETRMCI